MTEDDKQDALAWLERWVELDQNAQLVLDLIEEYETRENTAIGMLTARLPHAEIRDYLLTGERR